MILVGVVAGIIFPLTKSLAGMQDGDGILAALISTQKLTWYYWGQDRFLNFIPALAKPFVDVEWNLRFQLFLRAFFAFLAPSAILYFFNQSAKFLTFAIVLTNCLLGLIASQYAIFNLYVEENPYGTSLVLFAVSFFLFRRNETSVYWMLSALLVGVIAYATNMGLVVITFPLIFLAVVNGLLPRERLIRFFILNILCVLIAYAHSRYFGESETPLSRVNFSLLAIRSGYSAVASNVPLLVLVPLALISVFFGFMKRVPNLWSALLLMAGCGLFIGLLSLSFWVALNEFNIRYYLTFVIAIVSCISYLFASAFYKTVCAGVMTTPSIVFMLLLEVFFGLHGFSHNYSELVGEPWRDRSLAIANEVVANDVKLVVGDYWDVWPAVYEALRIGSDDGNYAHQIYGATTRGHVLRRKIQRVADKAGAVRAICFLVNPSDCVRMAQTSLHLSMSLIPGSVKEIAVADKHMLIMSLSIRP